MKFKIKFANTILLLFVGYSCFASVANPRNIVPIPQHISIYEGSFTLKPSMHILLKGNQKEALRFAAEEISQSLRSSLNMIAVIDTSKKITDQFDINLFIDEKLFNDTAFQNLKVKESAYYLYIKKDQILITAPTSTGVFYGAMSLIQLIEKADDKQISSCGIFDYADMKVRGFSDDISRGQVSTIENFKRIIRFIARYKMNMYQPYLEDMFLFSSYPTIGQGRGALSKEDVKELVEYAKKYFIDVVPVFETLGHWENILAQPEFARFAEFPGSASLDVSNDSIYILLDNMIKELFDAFPSQNFHIGADESFDVGLGNSKKPVEEKGIAKVHAEHYQKVFEICAKYNKTVMMYGDVLLQLPEILEMIPKNIRIVDWDYINTLNYEHSKKIKDAGFIYYVSPAVWNFETSFPSYNIALSNIQYFTKAGIDNDAEGMLNSQWGDYGAETFRELNLFGFAWGAQCSWNYNLSNVSDFSKNFFSDFFHLDDERIINVYQTLSNTTANVLWNDIWQHPMLKFRTKDDWYNGSMAMSRANFIDWSMDDLITVIDDLQKKSGMNKSHFDYLRYVAKMNKWYSKKLKTQAMLIDLQEKKTIDEQQLLKMVKENISDLNNLREEYKQLWLLTNRVENLSFVIDKFNRLITYFQETDLQLQQHKLKPPLIESKLICAMQNNAVAAKRATFKKEIILTQKSVRAQLQIIGDTYAQLFINGKYVDEVSATRQLSISVETKRVKLLDVSPFLSIGKNTIEVKVENFKKNGSAGCNVIGIISSPFEEIEVYSDEKWLCTTDSKEWKQVTLKTNNLQIIAPNFTTNRASWIER